MTTDRKIFSLLDVANSIQKTIADRYTSPFWLKAEVNKLNKHSQSGHCYPALVEKKEGKVVAEMQSVLWRDDYKTANQTFIDVLGEPLKDGITILFQASLSYTAQFGLKLRIIEIDPSYTLGELEKEKLATIKKLNTEGIFDNNKKLKLALLPKRIAIISADTSKGYSDFMEILGGNGIVKYSLMLFSAILQGEKCPQTIISQLRRIKSVQQYFDAVFIIRGGGGDVGLSCYNNYELAKEISLFPLPVISGIGHSTNATVCEMVAYYNAITPTAAADYLNGCFVPFINTITKAMEVLVDKPKKLITDEKLKLFNIAKSLKSATTNVLTKNRTDLDAKKKELASKTKSFINGVKISLEVKKGDLSKAAHSIIEKEKSKISGYANSIKLLDPANVLKRGYSITMLNDKPIINVADVKTGDVIHTIVVDGKIKSVVK